MSLNISIEAKILAGRLLTLMRSNQIQRVDIDTIRAMIAGYCLGGGIVVTAEQREDFENLTLRKFVEACA